MRHWNRTWKTVRNLLACLLLAGLVYGMLGFPPYTTGQKLRRLERRYLLEDLEPVYVERIRHRSSRQWYGRWNTLLIARSPAGDYVAASYEQDLLDIMEGIWWNEKLAKGNVGYVWAGGRFFVAGEGLRGAVSATAVVETRKRDFTLEGEQVGEGVFAFTYAAPDHDYDVRSGHGPSVGPDGVTDLLYAVDLWYWDLVREEDGSVRYHFAYEDLPCSVTAYDGAGRAVGTERLAIGAKELNSIYDRWW